LENLVFSLNSVMPIFLMMVLGIFLKKWGLIDTAFASKLNTFVFKVSLPILLFSDLSSQDFREGFDLRFVVFCFAATLLSIGLVSLLSLFINERPLRGEFIQAAYRSSAALIGIAFIKNIYGTSGMGPLMIIGAVPLYNIMAVVVLEVTAERNDEEIADKKALAKKTALGIVKNPILIGIVVGLVWSLLRLPNPVILRKLTSSIGATATPMGLIAMGAMIDFSKIREVGKPVIAAALIKTFGLEALFMPIAAYLGFRNENMVAIMTMLGSATTVSSFVMAKNMGHEGSLTAGTVALSTLISGFSLTFWLWLAKTLGLV